MLKRISLAWMSIPQPSLVSSRYSVTTAFQQRQFQSILTKNQSPDLRLSRSIIPHRTRRPRMISARSSGMASDNSKAVGITIQSRGCQATAAKAECHHKLKTEMRGDLWQTTHLYQMSSMSFKQDVCRQTKFRLGMCVPTAWWQVSSAFTRVNLWKPVPGWHPWTSSTSHFNSVLPPPSRKPQIPVPKKNKVTCLSDDHPVALALIIMKCFEWLVMPYICANLIDNLDPLQFA